MSAKFINDTFSADNMVSDGDVIANNSNPANSVSVIQLYNDFVATKALLTTLITDLNLNPVESAILKQLLQGIKLDTNGKIIANQSLSPQTVDETLLTGSAVRAEHVSSGTVTSYGVLPSASLGQGNVGTGTSISVPSGVTTDLITSYTNIYSYSGSEKLLIGGTALNSGAPSGTNVDLQIAVNISNDGYTLTNTYTTIDSGRGLLDVNGNISYTAILILPMPIIGAITLLATQATGGTITFPNTSITIVNLN